MRRNFAAALSCAGLAVALGLAAPAAAGSNKPVVELFTSQGCSSCPPADAFLVELSRRGDVIALSQHVDYWNYIGWSDPFSSVEATQRQKAYKHAFGGRFIYTPQMVIDGATEAVGSERATVEARIKAARGHQRMAIRIERDGADATTRILIPAGFAKARGATVWQMPYDRLHTTQIERGENKGVTLVNANVVRGIVKAGTYTGEAMRISLDLDRLRADGRQGCAILVQDADGGRIWGAVALEFGPGS